MDNPWHGYRRLRRNSGRRQETSHDGDCEALKDSRAAAGLRDGHRCGVAAAQSRRQPARGTASLGAIAGHAAGQGSAQSISVLSAQLDNADLSSEPAYLVGSTNASPAGAAGQAAAAAQAPSAMQQLAHEVHANGSGAMHLSSESDWLWLH